MRRAAVVSVLSALALAAIGCASRQPGPVEHTTETVRVGGVGVQPGAMMTTVASVAPGMATIPAPIERVWSVLPAVYDSLGIPIDRLDQGRFIIGNPELKVRRRLGGVLLSRYLDCGSAQGGPSAETYEVTLSVLTELSSKDHGVTTAATVVQAVARPVTFAGEPSRCTSSGQLERRLSALIGELL